MTVLTNNAEGGTHPNTVTTGNSGGGSGNAFDNVNGAPTWDNTDPLNGSLSILCDGAASNYVGWTTSLPTAAEAWVRIVGKVTAHPTANAVVCQLREGDGSTTGTDIRMTTTGTIQLRPNFIAEYTSATAIPINTIFRLEIHVSSSATVGHIEAQLYVGANVWGATPDESFGVWANNHNTGDGDVGGFTAGWITNPSGDPDFLLDELGYSDVSWLGSPVSSGPPFLDGSIHGIYCEDVPVPSSVSSLLVPENGAWFGVTSASVASDGGSTSTTGLAEWEAAVNRPHIVSIYKTGAWNGVFTAAENDFFDPAGGKHAIPLLHWKINSSGATWADVAAGNRDADIIGFATGIKSYGRKCFMSFFHEPEDNVGGTGWTKADYVGMWQRAVDVCNAEGVTNLVYVIQYIGYSADAVDSIGTGFEDMYPGDAYVDWIGWDPYNKQNPSRDAWGDIVNENIAGTTGWNGFYNWAQTQHPSKPLMICETGAGIDDNNNPAGGMTVAQATTCYNGWALDTTAYPEIRAVVFWNSRATYDYFVTKPGRETAAAAVKTWSELTWFSQQDPDLAP